MSESPQTHLSASRRDFMKSSAIAAGAAGLGAMSLQNAAYAQGSDEIRVGLIGCGGRGTGAATNAVESSPNVKVVALGDLFEDRLKGSIQQLQNLGDAFDVPADRQFVGWDAYKKVLAESSVNYVILGTPPAFRPDHFLAAVAAGKNVFMEKPVAVDVAGIKKVIEGGKIAEQKKLGVVAGTQRRHQSQYLDTIGRIHDGEIGDVKHVGVYWNQGGLWFKPRDPSWSDLEWQLRNWLYFTWLSGDHIVEQHVHNIDVANWVIGKMPEKVLGMGGRQSRTGEQFGHIYDHFAIEFEYPDGQRVLSMCRQAQGASNRVGEYVLGTKGISDPQRWIRPEGKPPIRAKGGANPYVQEHTDLIASIRDGKPLNESQQIAESNACAIAGRMSAYSGRELKMDWLMNAKQAEVNMLPAPIDELNFEMKLPVPEIPVPGQTRPDDTLWPEGVV